MTAAEILAGGARLVRTQPKAVAIWGLLYLVIAVIAGLLILPMMGELIAFQQQVPAARASGLPPPPLPAGFIGAIFDINAVTLVGFAAIFAAAVRAVARGGEDPFGFLRFGMDELRLLGLFVLLGLIGIVAFIVFLLVAGLIAAGLGVLVGPAALAIVVPFYLVLIAGTVWAQVRISLAPALTVLCGRIVIRDGWRLTRGRFWPLFGVYLLIWIVFFVIAFALAAALNPGMLAGYTGSLTPAELEAMIAQQQADMFGPRWIVFALLGAVVNAVMVAFAFGAIATAAIGYDQVDRQASAGPA